MDAMQKLVCLPCGGGENAAGLGRQKPKELILIYDDPETLTIVIVFEEDPF